MAAKHACFIKEVTDIRAPGTRTPSSRRMRAFGQVKSAPIERPAEVGGRRSEVRIPLSLT